MPILRSFPKLTVAGHPSIYLLDAAIPFPISISTSLDHFFVNNFIHLEVLLYRVFVKECNAFSYACTIGQYEPHRYNSIIVNSSKGKTNSL